MTKAQIQWIQDKRNIYFHEFYSKQKWMKNLFRKFTVHGTQKNYFLHWHITYSLILCWTALNFDYKSFHTIFVSFIYFYFLLSCCQPNVPEMKVLRLKLLIVWSKIQREKKIGNQQWKLYDWFSWKVLWKLIIIIIIEQILFDPFFMVLK